MRDAKYDMKVIVVSVYKAVVKCTDWRLHVWIYMTLNPLQFQCHQVMYLNGKNCEVISAQKAATSDLGVHDRMYTDFNHEEGSVSEGSG